MKIIHDKIFNNTIKKDDVIHMTVCVAAICENNSTVVCASDRMLTTGDVEFEPQKSKIILLTNSIIIMTAGDSSLQSKIIQKVKRDVRNRIQAEPQNWWKVEDVVGLYNRYFFQAKQKKAENDILAPLNLDSNSFIANQQTMNPQLVSLLCSEIINFKMPQIAAIFTGVDTDGAHIYTFEDENIQCLDSVGFGSIGIGQRHSNSEFMFASHVGTNKLPETLLLAYSAKKRAEVAPGVGRGTDMCFIGPYLGSFYMPKEDEEIFKKLGDIYKKTQDEIKTSGQKAKKDISEYIQKLVEAAVAAQKQEMPIKENDRETKPKKD
jgi:hypothetical protein